MFSVLNYYYHSYYRCCGGIRWYLIPTTEWGGGSKRRETGNFIIHPKTLAMVYYPVGTKEAKLEAGEGRPILHPPQVRLFRTLPLGGVEERVGVMVASCLFLYSAVL